MTPRHSADDTLDEVLAEIEAARHEPVHAPEPSEPPRRLVRPPEVLEQGRWVPSRTAIVVIVVCAVLAFGIFVARVLLSQGSSRSASPRQVAVTGTPSGGLPGSKAVTNETSSKAPTTWTVHVVGAVKHPGVVSVRADSRVSDAVTAAGGLTQEADSGGVNLARKLTDGEQVHVPKPGEKWSPPTDGAGGATKAPEAGEETKSDSGSVSGAVNLNTATMEQLDSLPGVGPVMAQRILDWRQEHGKFSSVDELGEVSGIGDKTLAKLKPKITV